MSFDVSSLYTNVPVYEAMEECTNLFYSGRYKKPPVDKQTFRELLESCSFNVIMLTNEGYYQQIEGLAMGSPPVPLLANGRMHKFDDVVKGHASLFARYMDDYERDIKLEALDNKLKEINELHPSLKFTMEVENNSKTTDTGLLMNTPFP